MYDGWLSNFLGDPLKAVVTEKGMTIGGWLSIFSGTLDVGAEAELGASVGFMAFDYA